VEKWKKRKKEVQSTKSAGEKAGVRVAAFQLTFNFAL
jgi:hypothetical protein